MRLSVSLAVKAAWTHVCFGSPQLGLQPAADDRFGSSVSLSCNGAVLVVGAPEDVEGISNHAGSVWIINKEGGAWVLKQRLVPVPASNTLPEEFEKCLSLNGAGTALAVGAPSMDTSCTPSMDTSCTRASPHS